MTQGRTAGHRIRRAGPLDLPAARRCYERNGYSGGIRAEDRVLVAERDGAVVGVVRLVEEEGHLLLRGLFIDEAERGRGLGRRMLACLMRDVGPRTCWLVCRAPLASFYGEAGFEPSPEVDAPPHLLRRAAAYARLHGPQAVLRRRPSATPRP